MLRNEFRDTYCIRDMVVERLMRKKISKGVCVAEDRDAVLDYRSVSLAGVRDKMIWMPTARV